MGMLGTKQKFHTFFTSDLRDCPFIAFAIIIYMMMMMMMMKTIRLPPIGTFAIETFGRSGKGTISAIARRRKRRRRRPHSESGDANRQLELSCHSPCLPNGCTPAIRATVGGYTPFHAQQYYYYSSSSSLEGPDSTLPLKLCHIAPLCGAMVHSTSLATTSRIIAAAMEE
jgi:hypothetical protein